MEIPKLVFGNRAIDHYFSSEAAVTALKQAVEELTGLAPKDHDVLVQVFNLAALEVRHIEPHSLLFRCVDERGQDTYVICHFSQLVARVIYQPKRGTSRVITGFRE